MQLKKYYGKIYFINYFNNNKSLKRTFLIIPTKSKHKLSVNTHSCAETPTEVQIDMLLPQQKTLRKTQQSLIKSYCLLFK